MHSSSLRVADLTADQLDEVIDVRARSFGVLAAARREEWKRQAASFAAAGRFLGVLDGDRVVAAARIWDLRQWWSGRRVPMGGVAGVVVAPEYRGRKVGTQLMRAVLDRCHDLGFAISTLYPNLLPIYRKVGYEFAGARYRFTFPAWALRTINVPARQELLVRRGGPADAGHLLDLVARMHERDRVSGVLEWPVEEVTEWLAEDDTFCYLTDGGFVVYRWEDSDLTVDELVAGSEASARALWGTVGSGSSTARDVHAYIAPYDPIHLLLRHEAEHATQVQRWMLRIVDAPAAVAARGWPATAELDVTLKIVDVQLQANSGTWRLRVSAGEGRLEPVQAAASDLRVTDRGLAALYAGTPVAALRTAALLTGPATHDAALDLAFSTGPPYALDFF